jgi:hypothetical protein
MAVRCDMSTYDEVKYRVLVRICPICSNNGQPCHKCGGRGFVVVDHGDLSEKEIKQKQQEFLATRYSDVI